MVSIPTPIPKSLVRAKKGILSGPVIDTVWKLFIATLFLIVGIALAAAGPLGIVVAGLLLGSLLNETVNQAIADIWNRNFWVFKT